VTGPAGDAHRSEFFVMACDNQDGEDDIASLFARGLADAGNAAGRILTIDGPVHAHPDDLRGEVRRRITGKKRLPDVIMLDHRFGAEDDDTPAAIISAVDSGFEYLAHETTLWITKLFRAREQSAPAIVIRSGAEQHLGLLDRYAFVQFGGAQVILKRMRATRQVELIFDAIDGKVWSAPPPHEPPIEFKGWQRELLPSFEARHTLAESIDWLLAQADHPTPENWEKVRRGMSPEEQRARLVETCRGSVEQARHFFNNDPILLTYYRKIDPDWPRLPRGSIRVIALGCVLAGEMFLRLPYRQLAPGCA
jgi:hypothetical protein